MLIRLCNLWMLLWVVHAVCGRSAEWCPTTAIKSEPHKQAASKDTRVYLPNLPVQSLRRVQNPTISGRERRVPVSIYFTSIVTPAIIRPRITQHELRCRTRTAVK